MNVYGSSLPAAVGVVRLLPTAASEARVLRPTSREAKRRLRMISGQRQFTDSEGRRMLEEFISNQ
jgi:hypothetical protein